MRRERERERERREEGKENVRARLDERRICKMEFAIFRQRRRIRNAFCIASLNYTAN